MVTLRDVFHSGYVVDDIESAQADFSSVFGVAWTDVEDRAMPVLTPDGPLVAHIRFTFSRGDGHRLELLEPVPGTVWQASTGLAAAAHHVGTWADDLAAESDALAAAGCPRVLTYDDGSGQSARFAYHRLRNGALVELVDASRRAQLEAFYDGAAYVPPPSTR